MEEADARFMLEDLNVAQELLNRKKELCEKTERLRQVLLRRKTTVTDIQKREEIALTIDEFTKGYFLLHTRWIAAQKLIDVYRSALPPTEQDAGGHWRFSRGVEGSADAQRGVDRDAEGHGD